MTMKRVTGIRVVAVVVLLLFAAYLWRRDRGFTPWMKAREFSQFLKQNEIKDSSGKNFWDRGKWIEAAQGRWKNGYPEYRIRIGSTPKDSRHWWYWWYGVNGSYVEQQIEKLSGDGFQLVQCQHYRRPGGRSVYQAVFHKVEKVGK